MLHSYHWKNSPNHFYSFRDAVGRKVMKALKRKDDGITHAVVDFLCALMQPMHDNFDLKQEQLNKSSLLSSKSFLETLLKELETHIVSQFLWPLVICFESIFLLPPATEHWSSSHQCSAGLLHLCTLSSLQVCHWLLFALLSSIHSLSPSLSAHPPHLSPSPPHPSFTPLLHTPPPQ